MTALSAAVQRTHHHMQQKTDDNFLSNFPRFPHAKNLQPQPHEVYLTLFVSRDSSCIWGYLQFTFVPYCADDDCCPAAVLLANAVCAKSIIRISTVALCTELFRRSALTATFIRRLLLTTCTGEELHGLSLPRCRFVWPKFCVELSSLFELLVPLARSNCSNVRLFFEIFSEPELS
ncbi:hypothetical protein Bhyg_02507 [Pseudolycoriella hygida]|uniref:Uncharacterized protein n=1 Tax=Pseudolycoriella hygida TaxID=35572 RepID=A0A9Q0S8F8_9DIPT|nr:hypothetical protein Bhyg_02507 [Pseudolycoriella hygida]